MAKYCTYIILLFSLFSCKKQEGISDTQGKTFVKYFGSFGFDKSTNMQQTDDEGFIIAGTISSLTNGKEAAIIKTDKYGNEQWTKIYGDSLDNFANNILSIDDGYLVLGTTTDSLLTTNMWLFKINSSGNVIWSKQYGSESNEQGISLVKSNVDGYILAGTKSNITTAGEETDFYF